MPDVKSGRVSGMRRSHDIEGDRAAHAPAYRLTPSK